MINILIFGSCVSRDAVEFFPAGHVNLVGYYARSSFASLVSAPNVNTDIIRNIPSKFQARVVKADMDKSFWHFLSSAVFDVLLVDLIDERFHIDVFADGSVHTVSADYIRALKGLDLSAKRINRHADKKFNLWKLGFDKLISFLQDSKQLEKLKVNKVYWSALCDEGKLLVNYDKQFIDDANRFLNRMYSYIENRLGADVFIQHNENCFVADSKHKWGIEPFHYTSPLYLNVVTELGAILSITDVVVKSSAFNDNVELTKTLKMVFDNKSYINRGQQFFADENLCLGNFAAIKLVRPIDWQVDPFENRTWQWLLNWFSFISDFIAVDHQEQNDKIIEQVLEFIEDWSATYLDCSLEHPFEFIWHDHATALRAEQVTLFIFYVIKHRYEWYKNNQYRIAKLFLFLEKHANLLLKDGFYSEHTNHGLEQSRVLLMLSTVMLGFENRAQWQKTAISRINSELRFSFTEEGVHVENSPAYHYFVLKIFLGIISSYKNDELGELSSNFRRIATKALEYLTHVIQPNGRLPVIGDTDEYRVGDIFKDYFAGTIEYENFIYVLSFGKKGEKPVKTVMYYPISGYVIARNRWGDAGQLQDDVQFIFKAGSLSQYHRHQDDGSFILNAKRKNIFVDSGLFNHNRADPIRKYVRSRVAHNVPVIRGGALQDIWQDIKSSWSMQLEILNGGIISLNYSSSIYKGFLIQRQFAIDFNKSVVNCTDSIISDANKPFSAEVLFHLAPELLPIDFSATGGQIFDRNDVVACQFTHNTNSLPDFQYGIKNDCVLSVMSKVKNEYTPNYVLKMQLNSDSPIIDWVISL